MIGFSDIPGTESMTESRPLRTAVEIAINPITEIDRLARRRDIKQGIAKSRLAEARMNELVQAIADVNQGKENLAAKYATEAAPIQAALAEIEKRQIAAIVERQPTDEPTEVRRKELLAQLDTLNRDLETAIAIEDKMIARIEVERRAAAVLVIEAILLGDLVRTARPDLKTANDVAHSAQQWGERRLTTATDRLHSFPKSASWQAEAAAARAEVERTRVVAEQAYQAMIDE